MNLQSYTIDSDYFCDGNIMLFISKRNCNNLISANVRSKILVGTRFDFDKQWESSVKLLQVYESYRNWFYL